MNVAVIVPSFNRPKLLRKALRSIKGASQIIIADDGSDFDVRPYATGSIELVTNPPIPPGERLWAVRVGALLNRALQMVKQPIVTYLNDDDLFTAEWVPAVAEFFESHPKAHICRGDWLWLGKQTSAFDPDSTWCLTTGNYAYRTECAQVEDYRWPEGTLSVHDAQMLLALLEGHGLPNGGYEVPHIGVQAGFRRDHKSNMVHHTTTAGGYEASAEAMFALGARE